MLNRRKETQKCVLRSHLYKTSKQGSRPTAQSRGRCTHRGPGAGAGCGCQGSVSSAQGLGLGGSLLGDNSLSCVSVVCARSHG